MVGFRGDADDRGPSDREQLHRDRPDTAGRGRYHHRVARTGTDGSHRGVGGHADHEQGAGYRPLDRGRFEHQVVGGDGDVLGMAPPPIGPSQDLVPDGEPVDPFSHLLDHASQVAALARRKGGREPGFQEALADRGLSGIDAGRLDRNQDLAG